MSYGIVCVTEQGGDVRCWTAERPETFTLARPISQVELPRNLLCTLDGAGALDCYDRDATLLFSQRGLWMMAASHGASIMCVIASDTGFITCFDSAGANNTADVNPPAGSMVLIEGTEDDPPQSVGYDGGTAAARGSDSTFAVGGGAEIVALTYGDGQFCYELDVGFQFCGATALGCDVLDPPDRPEDNLPGFFEAGSCIVCYLDEQSYGRCWSRLLYR